MIGGCTMLFFFDSFILAICELSIISLVRTNAVFDFCFELDAFCPKNLLRSLTALSGSRCVVIGPSEGSQMSGDGEL